MKKITSILLLIAMILGLSGCFLNWENPYPYRGSYKELYTAAIYSIPDASGYMHHGEGAYHADIYIWEQDDYGRTLFSYCEDYRNRTFALVICQAYDETDVYFYPDRNYVLTLLDYERLYEGAAEEHLQNRTREFYLEFKDQLKEENDWNKPLDKSQCVSYPITDHKVLGQDVYSVSRTQGNEILHDYTETLDFIVNPESGPYRYSTILQTDAEGKILHEIYGVHRDYDKLQPDPDNYTSYDMILWVITDQEGNYDKEKGILVMYSEANESDNSFIYDASEILEFKNKNGWANLYCAEEN